jgi:hypothetical protein
MSTSDSALGILFYSRGGAFRSQAGLYREVKRLKLPFTQKEVTTFVKNQLQKELFTPHRNTNSGTPTLLKLMLDCFLFASILSASECTGSPYLERTNQV